ncbi:HIRAN domain-containing protein [[Mycobacterium] crassicus]|uniref:HIRAN domain-containing protein n=1 Tax=[Mycobacterium] crassicus TaxID=2872309 RepID=A0ABU5XPL0_9MYCO|nr:HIRAN domain-containing protein [Mycolicibacter sp. MYC098]MEB3024136.1 HIRAN domain-containing protein [Mycolicibacter sp. MYC098]
MSSTTFRLWSDIRGSWCNYDVVGESHYLANIQSLFPRAWDRGGEELFRDLELVPEPDNPYDEWAISVRADGNVLGHLRREDAPAWAPVARRIAASGLTAVTDGRVYLYEGLDWANLDRYGDPQPEIRARVTIKLGSPELAIPLNNPPAVPHTVVPRSAFVQVTKEDEHFDTLFDYVPPSGRGSIYVTLHESVVATARTTKSVVDVRIDDKPVGQLTPQMSQRFLPMIRHFESRGLVTACQGDIAGSTVAAEVRIDAVKAHEVEDSVLEGPAIIGTLLIERLEDPRSYLVPAAYQGALPGLHTDPGKPHSVSAGNVAPLPPVAHDGNRSPVLRPDVQGAPIPTMQGPRVGRSAVQYGNDGGSSSELGGGTQGQFDSWWMRWAGFISFVLVVGSAARSGDSCGHAA